MVGDGSRGMQRHDRRFDASLFGCYPRFVISFCAFVLCFKMFQVYQRHLDGGSRLLGKCMEMHEFLTLTLQKTTTYLSIVEDMPYPSMLLKDMLSKKLILPFNNICFGIFPIA